MKKNTGWTHFYEKKPVNFLRVMKLLFVLMTVTSLSISAKTFSQYRVTLDVRNVGVMELFKEKNKSLFCLQRGGFTTISKFVGNC